MSSSGFSRRPPRAFDARVLFLAAIAVVAASLTVVDTIAGMLLLAVFTAAWHLVTTRSLRASTRVLAHVAPFAALVVVLNAVFVPGEALWSAFGLRLVSREGLHDGTFFALRLVAMLMTVSAFRTGTSPEAMARALYHFVRRVSRTAAQQVALFVFLSMGFVPLLKDELARIRMAQAFRGGDFTGSVWRRIGSLRSWLIPLIVSAVHRSGQLALAVELRDVRARLPRTIEAPRARAADAVLALATATVLVVSARCR